MNAKLYTVLGIFLVGLTCDLASGSRNRSIRQRRSERALDRVTFRLENLELILLEEQRKTRQLQTEVSELKKGDLHCQQASNKLQTELYKIKETLVRKCGCPTEEGKPTSSLSSANVLVNNIEQGLRQEKTSRREIEHLLEIVKTRQKDQKLELEIFARRQENHQLELENVKARQEDHQLGLENVTTHQEDHHRELETLKEGVFGLRMDMSNIVALRLVRVVGAVSGTGDDAESRATCPEGTAVISCDCSKPPDCDGTSMSGRSCTAFNSYHGPGQQAIAVCKRADIEDFQVVRSGELLDPNPLASCAEGYQAIYCLLQHPWNHVTYRFPVMDTVAETCGGTSCSSRGCISIAICAKTE